MSVVNVMFFSTSVVDPELFAHCIRKGIGLMTVDGKWKDLPFKDIEVKVDKADTPSDKKFCINVVVDTSLHRRVEHIVNAVLKGQAIGATRYSNLCDFACVVVNDTSTPANLRADVLRAVLTMKNIRTMEGSDVNQLGLSAARRLVTTLGIKPQENKWPEQGYDGTY